MSNTTGEEEAYIPERYVQETKMARFQRHFNPGVIIGVGLSLYAMRNMVVASRKKDAMAFNRAQKMRVFSSLGAIVSLMAGYTYNNWDRVKEDFGKVLERWGVKKST